jgi:hypothetical protein
MSPPVQTASSLTLLVKSRLSISHAIGVRAIKAWVRYFCPLNIFCKIAFPRVFDLPNRVNDDVVCPQGHRQAERGRV